MNTILQQRIDEAAKKEAWKRYRDCPPVGLFGTGDYEPAECYESDREVFIDAVNWCVNYLINNQWISIEEALPSYGSLCLVEGKCGVKLSIYMNVFNDASSITQKIDNVTHWMEIPNTKKTNALTNDNHTNQYFTQLSIKNPANASKTTKFPIY